MSEPTYYLRSRGKVAGPFPLDKLRKLKDHGRLGRSHQLSTDRVSWTPAGNVAALYGPAGGAGSGTAGSGTAVSDGSDEPQTIGEEQFSPHPDPHPQEGGAAPPDAGAPLWYYRAASGDRVGPTSAADLRGRIAVGEVRGTAMVWREGMEAWAEADTRSEFAGVLPSGGGRGFDDGGLNGGGFGGPRRYSGLAIASLPLSLVGLALFGGGFLLASKLGPEGAEGVGGLMALASFLPCVLGLICGVAGTTSGLGADRRKGLGLSIPGLIFGLLGVAAWPVLFVLVSAALVESLDAF